MVFKVDSFVIYVNGYASKANGPQPRTTDSRACIGLGLVQPAPHHSCCMLGNLQDECGAPFWSHAVILGSLDLPLAICVWQRP